MNKILFKVRALGMGGIERLTIDILNNLKLENREIILMIEDEEEKGLDKQLSSEIKKVYLKPKWFNPLLNKVKNKKRNIFEKIYYNFLLFLERQILSYNINKYIKNDKGIKLFVDYDGGSTKYIHRIKNVKRIMWKHLSIANMNSRKKKRYGKRLNNYDLIICICDEMKEELLDSYSFLKNKIKRIYNFIDVDKILEKAKSSIEIEKDKKLLSENYCVSIGRLAEPKDYFTTIGAFEILKKQGTNEKLYIIGDGPDKNKLKKIIKDKNLENQVFLLGMKENPYIWLKNADIFIHSSKLEGFPMVLLEALACETVIISSKCKTGVKEILDLGVGEGFEIGDSEKLSKLIDESLKLSKKDLEEKYIDKMKKSKNIFSQEKILTEYQKILLNYSK